MISAAWASLLKSYPYKLNKKKHTRCRIIIGRLTWEGGGSCPDFSVSSYSEWGTPG